METNNTYITYTATVQHQTKIDNARVNHNKQSLIQKSNFINIIKIHKRSKKFARTKKNAKVSSSSGQNYDKFMHVGRHF